MPTLPDYPGVSHVQTRPSPALPHESMNLPDTTYIKSKPYRLHLSDLFWPMLGISGKEFLTFDEFLRFNEKISTLNNAF